MRQKLTWIILLALGAIAGSYGTLAIAQATGAGLGAPDIALAVLIGAVLGLSLMYIFFRGILILVGLATQSLRRTALADILAGVVGLIPALLIGVLVTIPLPHELPFIGPYLPITVTLAIGYIGMVVAIHKRDELKHLFLLVWRSDAAATAASLGRVAPTDTPKILDTSVIIDGRILDICRCGFIEGALVIPGFVLRELQHIADSSDSLRRNRGRRGLDILNRIQKELKLSIQISDKDFDDIPEVDAKVVRLAQVTNGKVVTNDFNLNKVCELQGVPVLNINELANAVKPILLPGEEMLLQVVKEGKELGQGVGYLDDGTMIVVDGGRRHIGETIAVLVTSVLQTSAGRLIFAKPKPGFELTERAL